MTTGWNCPRCGKAHGPHVDTCQEVISEHKFRYAPATMIGVRDGPKKMEGGDASPHVINWTRHDLSGWPIDTGVEHFGGRVDHFRSDFSEEQIKTPKVSDGGVVTNEEGVRVKRRLREPRFKTVEDAIDEMRKYIIWTFTGEEPSALEVLENAVRKMESVEKLEQEISALRRHMAMSGGIT